MTPQRHKSPAARLLLSVERAFAGAPHKIAGRKPSPLGVLQSVVSLIKTIDTSSDDAAVFDALRLMLGHIRRHIARGPDLDPAAALRVAIAMLKHLHERLQPRAPWTAAQSTCLQSLMWVIQELADACACPKEKLGSQCLPLFMAVLVAAQSGYALQLTAVSAVIELISSCAENKRRVRDLHLHDVWRLITTAGVFELQGMLFECVYRVLPKEPHDRVKLMQNVLTGVEDGVAQKVLQVIGHVNPAAFIEDARCILNLLNNARRAKDVTALPASFAAAGLEYVEYSGDSTVHQTAQAATADFPPTQVWIDMNTHTLSVACEISAAKLCTIQSSGVVVCGSGTQVPLPAGPAYLDIAYGDIASYSADEEGHFAIRARLYKPLLLPADANNRPLQILLRGKLSPVEQFAAIMQRHHISKSVVAPKATLKRKWSMLSDTLPSTSSKARTLSTLQRSGSFLQSVDKLSTPPASSVDPQPTKAVPSTAPNDSPASSVPSTPAISQSPLSSVTSSPSTTNPFNQEADQTLVNTDVPFLQRVEQVKPIAQPVARSISFDKLMARLQAKTRLQIPYTTWIWTSALFSLDSGRYPEVWNTSDQDSQIRAKAVAKEQARVDAVLATLCSQLADRIKAVGEVQVQSTQDHIRHILAEYEATMQRQQEDCNKNLVETTGQAHKSCRVMVAALL
ncbi:hypothetical protein RI367_007475 [Sorochytrium milnesiophthora]